MRELDTKTQVLRELQKELGVLDSPVKENELKKTRPYWTNQPLGDRKAPDEGTVDMVIQPHGNVAMIFRFIVQLERILDKYDAYGKIIRIVPSWDRGTIITVSMKLSKRNSLLDKLSNMPEVEDVEEEPPDGPAVSIFSKRFEFLMRLGIKSGKRVCVTLNGVEREGKDLVTKDIGTVGRELVPVPA